MSPASAILDALDAEAQAIMRAEFDTLGPLQQRAEQLLQDLKAHPPAHADLREIKRRLRRNQSLMQAAIRGVAAARARLQDLATVQNGLRIYDQSGICATVTSVRKNIEKKA